MNDTSIPVITIDGPSGSGKGTVSRSLAKYLGWHFLDSGALYRALAWGVLHHQVSPDDTARLQDLLQRLNIQMRQAKLNSLLEIICDGQDITQAIRASTVAAIPAVRAALLQKQRDLRKAPGLIADGRDMGTVVFPDAIVKIYLEASPAERAKRRYKQLKQQGINVSLRHIEQELIKRDERDTTRAISPLKPASDVLMIDTTEMAIDQVLSRVIDYVNEYV